MSVFPTPLLLDTFTDADGTALTAHTSDSGTAWKKLAGSGTAPAILVDQLAVANASASCYVTGPYSTTDVTVVAEFTGTSLNNQGVILSVPSATTFSGYVGTFTGGQASIYQASAGSVNLIDNASVPASAYFTNGYDANVVRLIRRLQGGNIALNLLMNGVLITNWIVGASTAFNGSFGGIYTDTSDGVQAPMDNFKVFPASSEVGIGMVGDSITAGTTANVSTPQDHPPAAYIGAKLTGGPHGWPVVMVNAGVSGTTSTDWSNTSSGSYLSTAMANFASNGVKVVTLMLGTNDCKSATRISIAQYLTNMTTIVNTLVGAGYLVVFNRPQTVVASGQWDALSASEFLPGYWAACQSLCNGLTVFQGDSSWFDITNANPSGTLIDGIHATFAFNRIMSLLWAAALAPVLQLAVNGTTALQISGPSIVGTTNGGVFTISRVGGLPTKTFLTTITVSPGGGTHTPTRPQLLTTGAPATVTIIPDDPGVAGTSTFTVTASVSTATAVTCNTLTCTAVYDSTYQVTAPNAITANVEADFAMSSLANLTSPEVIGFTVSPTTVNTSSGTVSLPANNGQVVLPLIFTAAGTYTITFADQTGSLDDINPITVTVGAASSGGGGGSGGGSRPSGISLGVGLA